MEQSTSEEKRATRRRPGAERLLEAASDLFYREGIRAVGVDTISSKAGVSKRTLYNRFGVSELVAEYLRRRDERWSVFARADRSVADPGRSSGGLWSLRGMAGGRRFSGLCVRQRRSRDPRSGPPGSHRCTAA